MIADSGISVILVEQHARVALDLARQAIALDRCRIVYQGPSAALLGDRATLDRTADPIAQRIFVHAAYFLSRPDDAILS